MHHRSMYSHLNTARRGPPVHRRFAAALRGATAEAPLAVLRVAAPPIWFRPSRGPHEAPRERQAPRQTTEDQMPETEAARTQTPDDVTKLVEDRDVRFI